MNVIRLEFEDLPKLSKNIKESIAMGMSSLYSIEEKSSFSAEYILGTSKHYFFINENGEITSMVESYPQNVTLKDAITFNREEPIPMINQYFNFM